MGSIAEVFTGFNQAGKTYTDGASGNLRYARTNYWQFLDAGISGEVSSIRVFAGSGAPALLLFRADPLIPWLYTFHGEFMQFTNASDIVFDLNLDGNLAPFNDDARSMLVVQTQLASETRLSFRDTFASQWNQFLDQNLPGDIERIGDPHIRWDAFVSYENLNPDRIYIRIKQKLNVVLDWWSDYEASIKYWIRLWASGGGVVAGVKRWEYWVEGGLFSSDIAEELEPKVAAGAGQLESKLNTALAPIAGVTDVYFLPGKQTAQVKAGYHDVHWEDTRGDVTVVIQK